MMDNSDILINVINECVEKALQKSNILTKTMGTVISLTEDNTRAKVKVGGFDTSFELLNKTGEILSIDDKVFIESINGNLTNGFISEKFGIGNSASIESGSNENGSYIKFSDGTMICRKYINFGEMEVSNTWGSMYETSELSIGNYAQPFIETPQISVMPLNTFFVEKRGNTTATSWGSFWAVRPVSTTMYIGVDCIAIGKWK